MTQATRRKFLKTSAGVAAVLSGSGSQSSAKETDAHGAEKEEKKTAEANDRRSPLLLHLLGCGYPPPPSASGNHTRHGSAFLVQVGPEFLMIDCGPGTT